MPWHYQILAHKDGSFGLHEVHCDKGSSIPHSFTTDSVIGGFEDLDELRSSLSKMLNDSEKYPVFTPPANWGI